MEPTTVLAGAAAGGALLNYIGASSANAKTADEARKARLFYRNMANTAHQREVTDLRAAGLNPILSAGGGGSAAAPTAAPTMQNEFEGIAATAMEMAKLKQDLAMQKSEIELNEENKNVAKAIVEKETATAKMIKAQLPGEAAESQTKSTLLDLVNTGGKNVRGFRDLLQEKNQNNAPHVPHNRFGPGTPQTDNLNPNRRY